MGRTAHCPPRKRSLRSLALGDANRGVYDVLRGAIGRARRTDPPSGGLFHVRPRFSGPELAASVQSHRPVRTPDEVSTVRVLGRAAAAVLLLPAILGRGGARQGRRGSPPREFESASPAADDLARTRDVEGVARTLLDELAALFTAGFLPPPFVSADPREP